MMFQGIIHILAIFSSGKRLKYLVVVLAFLWYAVVFEKEAIVLVSIGCVLFQHAVNYQLPHITNKASPELSVVVPTN